MRAGATLKSKHLHCTLPKYTVHIEKKKAIYKRNSLGKAVHTEAILFLQHSSLLLVSHKTEVIYFPVADI